MCAFCTQFHTYYNGINRNQLANAAKCARRIRSGQANGLAAPGYELDAYAVDGLIARTRARAMPLASQSQQRN